MELIRKLKGPTLISLYSERLKIGKMTSFKTEKGGLLADKTR
jgi:hypothetical protein